MTPTREAVTWGSPLYTFRWLLDRGSWEGRGRGGLGKSSPGPMDPGAAALSNVNITPEPPLQDAVCKAPHSPALSSPRPGRGQDEPKQRWDWAFFAEVRGRGSNSLGVSARLRQSMEFNRAGAISAESYHRARLEPATGPESHCTDRSH